MEEKLLYYQRRAEAENSNGEIGSIIINKMGTHATQLPLLSNLNQSKTVFPVTVTGAISHGTNEKHNILSINSKCIYWRLIYNSLYSIIRVAKAIHQEWS
jgi:hypothetical protein